MAEPIPIAPASSSQVAQDLTRAAGVLTAIHDEAVAPPSSPGIPPKLFGAVGPM